MAQKYFLMKSNFEVDSFNGERTCFPHQCCLKQNEISLFKYLLCKTLDIIAKSFIPQYILSAYFMKKDIAVI